MDKSEIREKALALHADNRGKLETVGKVPLESSDDLSLAYTPGVAEPCREIAKDASLAYKYTFKGNMCAVVSDGSAVLGLGNIGGIAGLPVMEGKALLFKRFGGVDCFPICLATQDTEEIIRTCINIAPSFGGINLEDISAPRCFEIERRLKEALDIPVFHDDQHGTAIVVSAALINACRLTGKRIKSLNIVVNGAGTAGTAISKMLLNLGVNDLFLVDSHGIICKERKENMNWAKEEMAELSDREGRSGTLEDALAGSDVFIGVSKADILTVEMIRTMADAPFIFALANPNPEIRPELARMAGASVVGTGRSDYPNQINNVLAFPGVFRGAFDVRASDITENMKIAAAYALAELVNVAQLASDHVLPSPFDGEVCGAVAKAVADAARRDGVARL